MIEDGREAENILKVKDFSGKPSKTWLKRKAEEKKKVRTPESALFNIFRTMPDNRTVLEGIRLI